MAKKNKVVKTNNEVWILIGLVVFSLLLWETPVVYPIKLFTVLIHEISHGIMAILTGGSVTAIHFAFDLSGITTTKGGNTILIASAGYLGSLIIGALFFISANKLTFQKWLTLIVASIITITAVNVMQNGLQIFFSLIIALGIFLAPRLINIKYSSLLFKFLGLTSCFYVIVDIKQDLLTLSLRETDTQILEYLTGFPAFLIGLIWFVISVTIVFFLLRKSYSN